MIKIVTGKLGSGKTLYCVSEIIELLAGGVTVCTNIDLQPDLIRVHLLVYHGVRMRPEQIIRIDINADPDWHQKIPFGSRAAPVAVYLDEIHLWFNARDWQITDKLRRGLLSFLSQSRKVGVDVTFISQDKENVEKQFRALAEYEYFIFPMSHLVAGFLGKLPVSGFIAVIRDIETGTAVDRKIRTYSSRLFGLYKTESLLDTMMNELSAKAEKRKRFKLERVGAFERFITWLKLLTTKKPCE